MNQGMPLWQDSKSMKDALKQRKTKLNICLKPHKLSWTLYRIISQANPKTGGKVQTHHKKKKAQASAINRSTQSCDPETYYKEFGRRLLPRWPQEKFLG